MAAPRRTGLFPVRATPAPTKPRTGKGSRGPYGPRKAKTGATATSRGAATPAATAATTTTRGAAAPRKRGPGRPPKTAPTTAAAATTGAAPASTTATTTTGGAYGKKYGSTHSLDRGRHTALLPIDEKRFDTDEDALEAVKGLSNTDMAKVIKENRAKMTKGIEMLSKENDLTVVSMSILHAFRGEALEAYINELLMHIAYNEDGWYDEMVRADAFEGELEGVKAQLAIALKDKGDDDGGGSSQDQRDQTELLGLRTENILLKNEIEQLKQALATKEKAKEDGQKQMQQDVVAAEAFVERMEELFYGKSDLGVLGGTEVRATLKPKLGEPPVLEHSTLAKCLAWHITTYKVTLDTFIHDGANLEHLRRSRNGWRSMYYEMADVVLAANDRITYTRDPPKDPKNSEDDDSEGEPDKSPFKIPMIEVRRPESSSSNMGLGLYDGAMGR